MSDEKIRRGGAASVRSWLPAVGANRIALAAMAVAFLLKLIDVASRVPLWPAATIYAVAGVAFFVLFAFIVQRDRPRADGGSSNWLVFPLLLVYMLVLWASETLFWQLAPLKTLTN